MTTHARCSPHLRSILSTATLLTGAFLASPLHAQTTVSWIFDGDGTWTTGANWSPSVPNLRTEIAGFGDRAPAAITVTINEPDTINGLSFSSTLTAYTLNLTGTTTTTFRDFTGATTDPLISVTGSQAHVISGSTAALAVNADSSSELTISNSSSAGTGLTIGVALKITGTQPKTLTFDGTGTTLVSGVIQDSGAGLLSLSKNGTGTVVLTAANTYRGTTTITEGTLESRLTGTLGSGGVTLAGGRFFVITTNQTHGNTFNVSAPSTIDVDAGRNFTLGDAPNDLTGSGTLTKIGGGTLTLGFANDHSGGLDLNVGTLALAGAAALGTTGTISFGGGTLQFSAANTTDYSSRFSTAASQAYKFDTNSQNVTLATALSSSGGSLTKSGAGTLTLSGTNTYTGTTTINAGTLALLGGAALANTGAVTLANTSGATLQLSTSETIGSLAGGGSVGGNVALGSSTLTTGGDNTSTTYRGIISGTGGLTKIGTGGLTLDPHLAVANTYTGATTVNGGTLILQMGFSSPVISGSSSLVLGGATVIAMGDPQFTVQQAFNGTTINAGRSAVRNDIPGFKQFSLNFGTISRTVGGTVDFLGDRLITTSVPTNGLLGGWATYNRTDWATVSNGYITTATYTADTWGAGLNTNVTTAATIAADSTTNSLRFATPGALTLTLSGTNTLTSGGILLTSGVGANSTTISGGTLLGASGTDLVVSHYNPSGALILASVLADNTSATGLTKSGAGTLTLTGNNTYTGITTVNTGTLQIGAGGTSGSIAGDIANNAALVVNRSDALTLPGAISGTGTLTQAGTGTLTLGGANSYTGGTTISAATLQIGAGGTTGSVAGNIANDAALVFNRSDALALAGIVSGTGSVTQAGTGTTTLSGANTYTGGTTLSAGTLALGSTGAIGATGTISFAGGTLQFGASNTTDYSARLSTAANQAYHFDTNGQSVSLSGALTSSGGSLTKLGSGTLTLLGSNTYTGATTVTAGTLALASLSALGTVGTISFGGGTLQFSANNTTDYSNRFSSAANQAYKIDTNGQPLTLATALTSSGGSLTKSGGGVLTLSGLNTYTGETTLADGTLQLGSSGSVLADTSAVIVNAGTFALGAANETIGSLSGTGGTVELFQGSGRTLTVNQSTADTFSGVIQGAGGSLIKNGSATLTLSGANTYSGGTTLSAGTLALASSGALGTTGTISLAGGTLQFSAANTNDYSNRFSTAANQAYRFDTNGQSVTLAAALTSAGGSLTKSGSGTLTLSGANTFTGPTALDAGILRLSGGAALANANAVTLANVTGATLALASSATIGSLAGGGNVSLGTHTLTTGGANTSTSFSGIFSDTGGLIKQGTGTFTLSGANTHTGTTTVTAGILLLSGSGTFGATTAALTANASGTFDFGGLSRTTGIVTLAGGRLANGTVSAAGFDFRSGVVDTVLAGSAGVTKTTSGLVTLSAANTYTGASLLTAGQLQLSGSAPHSTFTVTDTGALTGTGTTGPLNVHSGGTVSPGNSPGTLHVTGATTFGPGGSLLWEINRATGGTAGANPGWDLLSISGALNITAISGSKFTIALTSLTLADIAGLAANFNPAQNYSFNFATAAGGITGFDTNAFTLDTSGFTNPTNGGTWSLTSSANALSLTFTSASAIPEPSTYAALAGLAALAFAAHRRRQRQS